MQMEPNLCWQTWVYRLTHYVGEGGRLYWHVTFLDIEIIIMIWNQLLKCYKLVEHICKEYTLILFNIGTMDGCRKFMINNNEEMGLWCITPHLLIRICRSILLIPPIFRGGQGRGNSMEFGQSNPSVFSGKSVAVNDNSKYASVYEK